jgi:IS30 family transposase
MRRFTDEEKQRIWEMHQAGVPVKHIARRLGRNNASLRKLVGETGGVRPRARVINERHLSFAEREEISRSLAAVVSLRTIAQRLGRAPSTICREVNANGGWHRYRALAAERAARRRARRPKRAKLARCRRLRAKVEAKLAAKWSPEEIAGWLARTYPKRFSCMSTTMWLMLLIPLADAGATPRTLRPAPTVIDAVMNTSARLMMRTLNPRSRCNHGIEA